MRYPHLLHFVYLRQKVADSRRQAQSAYDGEYNFPERSIIPRGSLSAMDIDSEEEFGSTSFSGPSSPTGPLPPQSLPPIPANAVIVHRRADARQWNWMPEVIRGWRESERIPTHPEAPGSFPPIPSPTGEPVHETIPVLITRIHTLEQQLGRLELSDTETVDEETHNSEVTRLQHQLKENRRRITQLEEHVADRIAAHEANRKNRDTGTKSIVRPYPYKGIIDYKSRIFAVTKRAIRSTQWIEKTGSVIHISNCLENHRVKLLRAP